MGESKFRKRNMKKNKLKTKVEIRGKEMKSGKKKIMPVCPPPQFLNAFTDYVTDSSSHPGV